MDWFLVKLSILRKLQRFLSKNWLRVAKLKLEQKISMRSNETYGKLSQQAF